MSNLKDILINKTLQKFRKIKGPYSADSVFNKINDKTLFLSTYHDQALIPFKIINKISSYKTFSNHKSKHWTTL